MFDAPALVRLGWPHIDERVELDKVVRPSLWVEIDPPQTFLFRSVIKEQRFQVRMEFRIDCHKLPVHIDHGLDEIAEQPAGQLFQFLTRQRVPDNHHGHT